MTLRGFFAGLATAGICLAASTWARPPRSSPIDAATSTPYAPERPRRSVDTTPVAPTGRTIHVKADGNLQEAIDAARPGDLIALEAGATYRGPFRLPRKDGDA